MTPSWAIRYRRLRSHITHVPSNAFCTDASTPVPVALLEVDDPVRVVLRDGQVADREEARGAVDEVGEEEEPDLRSGSGGEREPEGARRTGEGRGGEHGQQITLATPARHDAATRIAGGGKDPPGVWITHPGGAH